VIVSSPAGRDDEESRLTQAERLGRASAAGVELANRQLALLA
jgi:hypothetical protein